MSSNILGSSFDKVKKSKGVSLAMFGSTWSVPSQIILSKLVELKGSVLNGRPMSYVDTDLDPYYADRLDIVSLPSFVYFINGEEVRRIIGAVSIDELVEEFELLSQEFSDLQKGVL